MERVSDKILVTGKYLNVIRECDLPIDSAVAEHLEYTQNEREYQVTRMKRKEIIRETYILIVYSQEKIERAYQFASKTLLELLLGEKKLLARLRYICLRCTSKRTTLSLY